MPTETNTLTITADYEVAASQHLIFTNQIAFAVSQAHTPILPPPHLRIAGNVEVLMTSAEAVGATGIVGIGLSNTFEGTPRFTIDPGGILKVSAAGGSATGYFGGGTAAPRFDNAGDILIEADGAARGLVNNVNLGVLTNSGQVTVTSTTADALGLRASGYGMQVHNSGTITVTGHGQVTGVDMGIGSRQVFYNSGTIVARAIASNQPSVGVYWDNSPQPGQEHSFVNDGLIQADRALETYSTHGAAAENLIFNNGRLIGGVWLGGGGAQTLVNNGSVEGTVRMIGAGSVYDGRNGVALGMITGSNNGGNTFLGGVGAESMTGGFSNDTIYGADGDDFIDGGGGADRLEGGAGVNTLSFVSLTSGVLVDVATGTAGAGAGADTFSGFSRILGSTRNDTIVGSGGYDYLRGAEGNDSIEGAAGFDDLHGNMGDDTVRGGGGPDWVVGGQNNDMLYGDDDADYVVANLGSDTCYGGEGGDTLLGGQAEDLLFGEAGDDWLSGDRGADTISGGTGADRFVVFTGSGVDLVTDFNVAEGDWVSIEGGAAYSLAQQGADAVITTSNGDQLVLLNTTATTLPPGSIFVT
ncbi:MAG TPA: calcium-binding protein [Phenylobacterium sp.]